MVPNEDVEDIIRAFVKEEGLIQELYELYLISGGYINYAFHLRPTGRATGDLIIKFVKPDAKAFPLSLDVVRMHTEAHGLKIGSKAAPEIVPNLIAQRQTLKGDGMVAMEYFPGRIMLGEAIFQQGRIIPNLGQKMGEALARISVGSSLTSLGRDGFEAQRSILEASLSVSSFMMTNICYNIFRPDMKSGIRGCTWPEDDDAMIRELVFDNEQLMAEFKHLEALTTTSTTLSPPARHSRMSSDFVACSLWSGEGSVSTAFCGYISGVKGILTAIKQRGCR